MISNFFASLISAIIPLVIIVGCFFLLYGMIKYESARPYLAIVFCIALLGSGVYSSMVCYDYYTSKSETRGEMSISDPYENFNIYDLTVEDISFYQAENGSFYLNKTYNKHFDFDGTNKNYIMLVNNQPCDVTYSTAGQIQGKTTLYVKDTNGNHITSFDLSFLFTFYGNEKTTLNITTNATIENINILNQYCQINGLSIRILNNAYNYYPILTGQPV